MRFQSILTIILTNIIINTNSTILSLTSSSDIVGNLNSNYTFQISNITRALKIRFNFENWSFLTRDPYSGSTNCYLGNTMLSIIRFNNQIQCTLTSTTQINQTLTFILTNMSNPSSTKSYYINATLVNSTGSQIITYNYVNSNYRNSINATKLSNISFSYISYTTRIGASNNDVDFKISLNGYLDNKTELYLYYNSSLINLNLPSTINYNAVSATGAVTVRNWTTSYLSTIQGNIDLTDISITNPNAAISYTIFGIFYFVQNTKNYTIQNVYLSITLTTIAFSSFTLTSPLTYGTLNSIDIASSCSIAQVQSTNTSNPAYSTLTYNLSLIFPTSLSNCSNLTTTSCKTTGTGSYRLSNFQTVIDQSTTTSITLTSFTFYQGVYYSLCRSTFTVSLTTQKITPTILSSQCDTNETYSLNNINLKITLGSALSGDLVYLYGFKGVIQNSNVWSSSIINNQTVYQSTLLTTYYSTSSTTMNLTIPLIYLNQNETTSNLLSKVELYRSTLKYAQTNNINVSLCSITKGKTITSFSLTSSNLSTYTPTNLSISATLQIFDYTSSDSLKINFISSNVEKNYVLSASLLSLNLSVYINLVQLNYTVLNNYEMLVIFPSNFNFPTKDKPTLLIQIHNVINPAIMGTLWLQILTYDMNNTSWIKQELTTFIMSITPRSLAYSIDNVYLLKNNTINLALSNPNRQILTINNTLSSTSLTLTLPSFILCYNYNNASSVASSWNYKLNTNTNNSVGNVSHLEVQLGSCYIKYFSSSINIIINETFNGITSTLTSVSLGNICGDNCYQCSSGLCMACFNSTNSMYILFYNNTCLSSCPAKSNKEYNICVDCHISCSSCNGKTYLNCTICQSGYSLIDGYCKSICGSGKYQIDSTCSNCDANCENCINSTYCYVCKQNATLIGSVCQFTSCFQPCSTCLGVQSYCTSCISGKYLYLSQCLSSCPFGSYQKDGKICSIITQSVSYMPISICGLVCVLLIIGLRIYSNKKIGNRSRRMSHYSNSNDINYKINILRLSSIVYSYLQIIAAIVLLAKNQQYQVENNVVLIVIIGLILHILSNLTFLICFIKALYKKVVDNQGLETIESGQSYHRKKRYLGLRFKFIVALSSIISFRTFKVLYSNLFIERAVNKEKLKVNKNQETKNYLNINNNDNNKEIQNNIIDGEKMMNNNKNKKDAMKKIKLQQEDNKVGEEIVPSRKLIRVNSLGDEQVNVQLNPLSNIVDKEDFINNQLTHPFLTYLTIISLFTGSLVIIIAASLEIYKSAFLHMLLWGLDCLLVTFCSFGLIAWDLWIFTNLLKEEQNSQMSSKGQQDKANHTHQNLKQQMEVEIKIQPQKESFSPQTKVKSSNRMPNMSKRSSKSKDDISHDDSKTSQNGSRGKKNEEIKIQNIPILKMFDDFQQEQVIEVNHHEARETKSKNFTTSKDNLALKKNKTKNKNVGISRNNRYSIANDIYINFQAQHQATNTQSKSLINQHKITLNSTLQHHQIKLQDDISSQPPPHFPDISQIQDAKIQDVVVNQSGIDEIIQDRQLDVNNNQQKQQQMQ